MSDLTGKVFGQNRSELIQKAKAIAAKYYGTDCIHVDLTNERGDRAAFDASFSAQEHHDVRAAGYGHDRCAVCKKESLPDHPLPRKKGGSR